MPTYLFKHRQTGEVTEVALPIAEREAYADSHPELERIFAMPMIVSGVDGQRRCDEGFKDLLRRMKKHNIGSTINIPS